MDITKEMQERIVQLETELAKKQHELESAHAEYGAHFLSIESKLAAVCQNEYLMNNENVNQQIMKPLVNKPEVYKGGTEESLESFIGHMELYVARVPEPQKLNVVIIFLGGHAFD